MNKIHQSVNADTPTLQIDFLSILYVATIPRGQGRRMHTHRETGPLPSSLDFNLFIYKCSYSYKSSPGFVNIELDEMETSVKG